MSKRKKEIKAPQGQSGVGKKPRVKERQEWEKPSWRFSSADCDGPFAWPKGKAEEAVIISKLHDFDSMDWTEIEGSHHHSIPVKHLSKDARQRLEQIRQDDIDEVFSFRLDGRTRIFCIRSSGVARLLWYDSRHAVCLSQKKHT